MTLETYRFGANTIYMWGERYGNIGIYTIYKVTGDTIMGKMFFQKIGGRIKCLFNKHQTTGYLSKSFDKCLYCGKEFPKDPIMSCFSFEAFQKQLYDDIYARTIPVKEVVESTLTLESMKVAIERVVQNPLYKVDRLYLSEKAKDKFFEEIKDQLIYEVKEPDGNYVMGMKLLVNAAVPDDMILMCTAKEVVAIVNLKKEVA